MLSRVTVVLSAKIIEGKPDGSDMDETLGQLQYFVESGPTTKTGVAVLTTGGEWRLYYVEVQSNLARKLVQTMDITNRNQREGPRILHYWLDKGRWR